MSAAPYKIFGSELSPYSVKVRAVMRYLNLPHLWLGRSGEAGAEFAKHAKMPLIPLVLTPAGDALQDSTPIIERLVADQQNPSIHPDDPALAFISTLLEELGDEWGNKWMFHYRWRRELDQRSCAGRIALSMKPSMDEAEQNIMAETIRERMVARVWFVGSSEQNAAFIESSFLAALGQLDEHLAVRPYLFGQRPAFGDFGVWAQLYEMWTDPTAGALITARAPNVLRWIQRMVWPQAVGPFETWASLEPTLAAIVHDWAGELFVPWSLANAAAMALGQDEFTVQLRGHQWRQKPQKYHARSLEVLRAKYAQCKERAGLDIILDRAAIGAAFSSTPGIRS